jgi:DNA-binding NtrC family response regulator
MMSITPQSSEAIDAGSPIRVLIAEDETHLGTILEQFMTARGFSVRIVRDGRSALEQLQNESFDVALLDVVMPELDGLEVLRLVRERPLPPEIIVITGNGTIETAMAALKLGAYDFLSKPYRMAEIDVLVRRAWEKRMLVRDKRYLQELRHREAPTPLVTRYAPFRAVLDMVAKFAPSPLPVLITGEVGTGKQSVARLLTGNRSGAFVHVDCARLAPERQVLELFGGRPADALGEEAVRAPIGALELASRGTLYLHNVDALGLDAQARVLEALDSGSFVSLDDARRVAVDLRIVASSVRELSPLVAEGRFSETLLHRLTAMRVTLPALRDRHVDIALLAEQFLAASAPAPGMRIDVDAMTALEQHSWPGNVRELELTIQRAVFLAQHRVVTRASLGWPAPGASAPTAAAAVEGAPTVAAGAPSLLELERRHIAEVLERTSWHQGRAAELLGISPKTLYRKIREYGFKRPSGRNA